MQDAARVNQVYDITIDRILNDESTILSGANVYETIDSRNWYGRFVHQQTNYLRLNTGSLDIIHKHLNDLTGWFCMPNVRTTPRIITQIAKTNSILQKKLRQLDESEEKYFKMIKSIQQFSDLIKQGKECYSYICQAYKSIQELAERAAYTIEQTNQYQQIAEAVHMISDATDIKRDFSARHRRHKKQKDDRAEEELVATALYISSVENRSCAIVTTDSNVHRVMNTAKYFYSHSSTERCRELIDAISYNYVCVYFVGNTAIERASDSRRNISKPVDINRLGDAEHESIVKCLEAMTQE